MTLKYPAGLALALTTVTLGVLAATPTDLLSRYAAKGAASPSADRGRVFFTSRHGDAWSCSSCHGEVPNGVGRHAATGKSIEPLAPAANAERFTDEARVEKWFRRNCKDVVGRECTAAEKADVLAWLLTVKK
jgi:hypothetical protein